MEIPATLTVTQRTNNTPGTYMATQVISFEGEFASGTGDEFTTLFVDQTSADPGTESGISYGIAAKGYRYGFNGKENDNEVKGEGNEQDYGMRIYDPRIGQFLSVDPLTPKYPQLTPYQFASNSPIAGVDMDGLEFYYSADGKFLGQGSDLKNMEVRLAKQNGTTKSGTVIISAVDINGNTTQQWTVIHNNHSEFLSVAGTAFGGSSQGAKRRTIFYRPSDDYIKASQGTFSKDKNGNYKYKPYGGIAY
ncbi:RHS repeat-associated core domain-containing protein [[Flexibacter] sp. ATCC 35208]|uniref:RHS repeat-associated core domain-containing protein n=1 Tax=[Flexibacter] sp. ATCC 35208 TaxID=1936242 RepID=UPI0009CC9298|nr:RHS repeat-associated core domain-containing protein [[Flexibacter] sp. ATCC 35208]OMP74524.1 hypothetical protein BW716_34915 [[Flexibacter] sp. ATCC 35208]